MSDLAAWGTLIGVVCTAVGGLTGGLIAIWFRASGRYQVEIMTAQATLNAAELKRKDAEIIVKDVAIVTLTTRVTQLEQNIRDLRDQGHAERDKLYTEQMKAAKESMERELRCHTEAAELRGQLTVLVRLVSDRLPGPPLAEIKESEPAASSP